MKIFARIISVVLQPVFIPLYGILMLLGGDILLQELTVSSKFYIALIIFITTSLLPATVVGIGMKIGKIHDEFIYNRRERTVPYILSLCGYVGGVLWLNAVGLSMFYIAPLIGSAISIVVIALVNLKWKISAHLSAMGGLTGGIFAYSYILCTSLLTLLSACILLSGLVGWSRMALKAHTLGQVCCGWAVGFLCVAATWIIMTL